MEQEKKKETLKEKWIRVRDTIRKPILFILTLIPIFGLAQNYYSLGFPMLNLWDLFVEYLFGSYWLAIFFIALIFFIILMLGSVSYYTVIIFLLYFLLAMSMGYGYPLITVVIAVFGTMYLIYQAFKWWENR
jgi:hypothetical protein